MTALARDQIVCAARGWIGTPYRHQASLKGVGCDCIGLVRGLWRELIGPEPEPMQPYTPDWAEASGVESLIALGERHFVAADPAAFAPGDLLVFRFRDNSVAKHVGVASDATHMIHAQDGARVAEVPIGAWRRRIVRAFAFPGLTNDRA
ncbi:MAG: C40 family peptidase [Hyphomicrobiales bacterium]|nr:C40 family peptidase [Hyphomicrobiales bacterium]